jgi:hypothetical protein
MMDRRIKSEIAQLSLSDLGRDAHACMPHAARRSLAP